MLSSNVIQILARPKQSTFKQNEGEAVDQFSATGTRNVFNLNVEKVMIQVFEK